MLNVFGLFCRRAFLFETLGGQRGPGGCDCEGLKSELHLCPSTNSGGPGDGAQDIRDQDIVTLIGCDLALFNFDGPELDSGTVTEFMFAKFADIPSLLLRTDFRRAGDQGEDPWNLMLSFYPRTRTLCLNSMEIYKKALERGCVPGAAGQVLVE